MRCLDDFMKEKYFKDLEASPDDLLSSQDGGISRRTLLLTFAAGLLGLGGFVFYRLTRIPGALEMFLHGDRDEKMRVLRALATGEKLPDGPNEEGKKKQVDQGKIDRFEKRLGKIRAEGTGFAAAEGHLLKRGFTLRHAHKYFRYLRDYLETIYSGYPVKRDIPFELLAEKINKFPEKRIFALICCCAGLPDDRGLNYMAISLFKRGYARLEGKKKGEAQYFLKVVQAVIYLRSAWYKNLVDATRNNPRKNEALQRVWNFLNTQALPHDLIRNKDYYTRPAA